MRHILAIDLGTSFLKGAVVDLDELRLGQSVRETFPEKVAGLTSLRSEFDPAAIVATTRTLMERLARQADEIDGVFLSTQMHGLVLTDARGAALGPLINWQDQRALEPHPEGGSYLDVLARRLDGIDLSCLGSDLRPGFPLCFLFWLKERGELPEGDVTPACLSDFVVANLSETTAQTHVTNAAAHTLLDHRTLLWDRGVIERLGLEDLRWPRIHHEVVAVGEIDLAGRRVPAFSGVGDHQCSLAGSLLREGELSVNVSTGSQISTLTPELELRDCQSQPFFDGLFLNLMSHIPAGRALDVLLDLLTEIPRRAGVEIDDPWLHVAAAVEETKASDVDVDLSFFRCATGDRGHLENLQQETLSVGSIFVGAFASMARNFRRFRDVLTANPRWNRIVFSGGIAQRFPSLRSAVEEELGLPSRMSPSSEDSLVGLMVLALEATGRAGSVGAAMDLVEASL